MHKKIIQSREDIKTEFKQATKPMNKFNTENNITEFKTILNDKLEKEVVAFLNSKTGGDLYIGVSDNGDTLGVENPDKTQLQISDRLKNNILPSCLGLFDVLSEEKEGKTIIHIIVSIGAEKPYYIKSKGMSPAGCYMRVGSGIQQMTTELINKLFASRTRDSLRNIVSPRYTEHSFAQLKIYYEEQKFTINDELLKNLDLYTTDDKLNYVAYLLADTNSVSIKVAKYAGTDKTDLIENEEYGFCSLIKATNRVLDKLEIENKTYTKITGAARRLERRMIDEKALREAFINAIVHNDYTKEVPPVVEIYSDRLSITSYGGLVEGLSEEEFFKGRSMPRNRELMRVFSDLDFVEQLGSGMHRILNAYDKNIFKISENFLEICFPYESDYIECKKTTEQDKSHKVNELNTDTEQVTEQVAEQVKRLILAVENDELSIKQIMQKLSMKHRPTIVYDYIKPALNLMLLEQTQPESPNSPTQKYRLTEKGKRYKKQLES